MLLQLMPVQYILILHMEIYCSAKDKFDWKTFSGPLDRSLEKQLSKKDNEYDKLSRENMATVNKFASPLLVCLCKDACDGHDVAKVKHLFKS